MYKKAIINCAVFKEYITQHVDPLERLQQKTFLFRIEYIPCYVMILSVMFLLLKQAINKQVT